MVINVGAIEVKSNSNTIPFVVVFEVRFGVDFRVGPINNCLSASLDDGALDLIIAPIRNLRRIQLLNVTYHPRLSAKYAVVILGANQQKQLCVVIAHQ